VESTFPGSVIIERIDWTGNTHNFATRLLDLLLEYGQVENGESAVVVLLKSLRHEVNEENREQIDTLIDQLESELPKQTPTVSRNQVFISYSRKDVGLVNQLKSTLEDMGLETWIDREKIRPGDHWQDAITKALNESEIFLLVCSKDSLQSEWVRAELIAAQNKNKTILPIIADDTPLPFGLSNLQALRISGDPEKDKDMLQRQLLRVVPSPRDIIADEDIYLEDFKKASDRLWADLFSEESPKEECNEVVFSAYYPRQVQAEIRYSFLVYAHLPSLVQEIVQDVSKFEDELGGQIPSPKTSKEKPCLKKDTPLTVMLECQDVEFEPFALTKKWRGEWIRFEFDFQASKEMIHDTAIVRVSVRAYGIEIACIDKCAFDVVEPMQSSEDEVSLVGIENPLALAKYSSQSVEMHKRIFVSYAREDTDVVESYRLAQEARGDDVFMDTYSIRSGEDWKKALAHAIDTVDIFQLFWSEHSSQSEYVQHEWDYAMTFRCKEDECRDFIRPVYWKKPMPDPPERLNHLNFAFVPFGLAGESLEWRLYHDEFWDRMETYFEESNVILKRSLRDLKRGQRAIYRRLERSHADELNAIMNALQDGKFEQREMAETLQGIERTLLIMRKYNARLDKRVREAVDDLTEAVESNLGLQQKLELALPIVPFFLDYKVELGAGSDVDLNKVWDELKERWSRLVNRIRGQEN